jgi:hypothetical protein
MIIQNFEENKSEISFQLKPETLEEAGICVSLIENRLSESPTIFANIHNFATTFSFKKKKNLKYWIERVKEII